MPFSGTEPITLIGNGSATSSTPAGDPIPVQTPTVVPGLFAPGNSTENPGQDTVLNQPAVFFPQGLPAGLDVSWVDAVQVRGITYQVDGVPADWQGPVTGSSLGVVVRLRGVLAEPS